MIQNHPAVKKSINKKKEKRKKDKKRKRKRNATWNCILGA